MFFIHKKTDVLCASSLRRQRQTPVFLLLTCSAAVLFACDTAFVINKEGNILHGVKSGYVYRLVVNMTIIGDKVETELLCYTRDWLNNTISIPMEDNCKRVK